MAQTNQTTQSWTSTQAYVLAVICLLAGGAIGYLLRGSTGAQTAAPETQAAQQQAAPAMGGGMGMGGMGGGQMPTPEQLKEMADKQAEPLLQRLKTSPTDASLLAQLGNLYFDAQVFPSAIDYYSKALDIDPKNDGVRTDRAVCYYSMGDPDHAIAELTKALETNPKNWNALFNRGFIKWEGKMDGPGAVADWQKLLKEAPNYEQRDKVEALIAQAQKHLNMKPGQKTTLPIN